MTYLEVVFNYGAIPGENELRAIDTMREVYGIRRVQFNAKERTVRVEFDASRLKQDSVAKLLRNAGVDVREPVCGASWPDRFSQGLHQDARAPQSRSDLDQRSVARD